MTIEKKIKTKVHGKRRERHDEGKEDGNMAPTRKEKRNKTKSEMKK